MDKIDPRLVYLAFEKKQQQSRSSTSESISSETQSKKTEVVDVLVRCQREISIEALQKAGLKEYFITRGRYTIVSGAIQLNQLNQLNELAAVEKVEASRPMSSDLHISCVDTRVNLLRESCPSVRGKGVIIGIVDDGIDYTHPDFCQDDGSSRILYLWDQKGKPQQPSNVPYGREYGGQELTNAIEHSSGNPSQHVLHEDRDGHGTHVAGIAAGNGRASQGQNPQYTGIAPDADLIVVALKLEDNNTTLGRSVNASDAFNYIVEKARSIGRPVVINCSQGMNGGGHSGETALEDVLNQLAQQPDVVIVKSAGNEGDWRIHAGGQMAQDEIKELELVVTDNTYQTAFLELWHDGADRIDIAIKPPHGQQSDFVSLQSQLAVPSLTFGSPDPLVFSQAQPNEVSIKFTRNVDETGDVSATLLFAPGSRTDLQPGTWKLLLKGQSIRHGRYDVWIERAYRGQNSQQIQFSQDSRELARTITIPGTAKRIITVGSYVTHYDATKECISSGGISSFSSQGPTRYGLQKPDIVAPGEKIISACSSKSHTNKTHIDYSGTSMAAPHVTGAAALILSVRPGLTCEQVKQILMKATRQDEHTTGFSDSLSGEGKLDVEAAILQARLARFPKLRGVSIDGETISWQTNLPTTSCIYFHPDERQLELGKYICVPVETKLTTEHRYNSSQCISGNYYFEIKVYSQEGWWTVDDNEGQFYDTASRF